MSITSGTAVCMRKASSYCAIRVSVSGMAQFARPAISFRSRRASSVRRRDRAVHARRVRNIQHRIALGAALHALIDRRQKAGCRSEFLPPLGCAPLEISTMKPGRFCVFGAEAIGDPGAQRRPARPRRAGEDSSSAGAWLNWSVCIDWTRHNSSATSCKLRHGVGHPDAALAVLGELAPRAQQLGRAGGEGEPLALE